MMFTGGASMARDFSQIIASGQLRVAIAAEDFLPWIGRGKDGELLGFEVDIATKLAEDMGVEAKFVERPFGDLIGSLTAKEVDIVISALSITPDRARRVMFSRPYGQSDVEMIVAVLNLPDGAAEQSYDMKGIKIAVIQHTTSELEGRQRFQEAEIVPFPDRNTARDAFLAGDVNAIIATKPYPTFIQLRDPDNYAIAGDPLTSTVEAVAVHPDNQRLLNFVDSWIYQAIASGFLEAATHHWFETPDWIDRVPGLREQIDAITKKEAGDQ
jgi:polar amino acid transport system substrate-binding protein